MNRIYHPHTKWEEVKFNMYGVTKPKERQKLVQRVIYFFNNIVLIEDNMDFVVKHFKNSCEHNFTNPTMNKIAWLGQSAVAFWGNIPEDVTREAWSYLNEKTQNKANEIAQLNINRWMECQKDI